MAIFQPFRAWRYETSRVSMDQVVAPPYDIISQKEQEALYARDPHNIVRIILGKDEPQDNEQNNKYRRAANYWKSWIEEGIVKQDNEPGYYLYETIFFDPQHHTKRRRLVVYGRLKLEPYSAGVVLPHEKTHAAAKKDRTKLIDMTRTNFSAVYGIYEDNEKIVQSIAAAQAAIKPLYAFRLESEDEHRLWQICDKQQIQQLSGMFSAKQIVIADGHHRYETSLEFSIAQHKQYGNQCSPSLDFTLVGLVERDDEGLIIFPIHRKISHLLDFEEEQFLVRLQEFFNVKRVNEAELHAIAKGEKTGHFGIIFPELNCYELTVKNEGKVRTLMPEGKPEAWYRLQVAQISCLAFKQMEINETNIEKHVTYTNSIDEAIHHVKATNANCSFIVPPIKPETIQAVCRAGEVMPQKSTYFFPKLGSGFLMHRHE